MAVNKIIIESNPFEKRVMYFWRGADGTFKKITAEDDSKLSSGDYTNTAFRNKAYEIVETIQKEFHTSDELEIGFIGTEEDYGVLCSTVESYFKGAGIKCAKEKQSYKEAKIAMPEIKAIFEDLEKEFEKEQFLTEEIKAPIKKYNDTIKPEITLCVIGLYSVGKSTFINSLIGTEILPVDTNPTTARSYKIYNREIYEIRFEVADNNICKVNFEGRDISISEGTHNKVLEAIDGIRESVDIVHDEKHHMREFLGLLNGNQEIETEAPVVVSLPFEGTGLPTDEYEFVIYDTPGSDSEENRDHFEKLLKTLDVQTNALPIVITKVDKTKSCANGLTREAIREAGESLDIVNILTVINQADMLGIGDLGKIKNEMNNYEVVDLKSANVLVMSSLWGCASKKKNPVEKEEWLDTNLWDVFNRWNPDRMREINLSEYNKITKNEENSPCQRQDDEGKEMPWLYQNSGLKAVEDEIADYAVNLALYNKCNQASRYLQDAIRGCERRIDEIKQGKNKELSTVRGNLNEKEKQLCDKLTKHIDEEERKYCDRFENMMSSQIDGFKETKNLRDGNKDDVDAQKEKLQNHEKMYTGRPDNEQKIKYMERYVQNKLDGIMSEFDREIVHTSEKYWRDVIEKLKQGCIEIVGENNTLVKSQKDELRETIEQVKMPDSKAKMELRENGIITHKKILFIPPKSEKINLKKCAEAIVSVFNERTSSKIGTFQQKNRDAFRSFENEMKEKIITKLGDFNVEVRRYSSTIKKLHDELDKCRKLEKRLNDKKEEIKKLLGEQEGA